MSEKLKNYMTFSQSQIGDSFTRPVLVTALTEKKTGSGKVYVRVTMKDGDSEQSANYWNKSKEQLKSDGIDVETIADAQISVEEYNGKSFTIKNLVPTADTEIAPDDFLNVPPVDRNLMYDEIISTLENVRNDEGGKVTPLSDLAIKILEDNKQKFMDSSASERMHHNLLGGLLYHTYRMVKSADALCNVYTNLDRELLICGTALHDIGKIWEYKTSPSGTAKFTDSGVLFGHLYMGASLIKQYSEKDNCKYNKEKIKLLVHLILSHHGKQEFGAVALPAVPEALALSHIDDLDAKMYVFDENYKNLNSGTISESRDYMLGTRIYKPHKD